MTYAQGTKVDVARSRVEIEKIVTRAGATSYVSAWEHGRAGIQFEMRARRLRFVIILPKASDRTITHDAAGRRRTFVAATRALDAETRRRWRAIGLVIKAKLESVASGVESFDDAFMANIVLPNSETIGEWVGAQLPTLYTGTKMPPLLPGACAK